MRVGIDVAPLQQDAAGTSRWIRGLLGELEKRDGLELRRLTWGGPGRWTAVARDVLWYPVLLPRAARRAGIDVLHCTIFRAPRRSRAPVVVTVHDLAVLRYPEAFPAWTRLYAHTGLRPTIRAARRVIAVSEFSRRETAELCGVDPDRIDVVPNAVDPVFTTAGRAAEGDYVLAVGTLEPRKNLPRAIEAARLAGVELRVVGARGWGGVEAEGAGVRWLGRVADEELAALYRGARCLVYPSLYEGFGIPVAEAMACGAPVVTSRDSAMAEVAGSAAVLVDPLDPRSIAAGIGEVSERGDELRRLGLERAPLYTWSRAAEAAVASYERACA
ncbi:Glycosyltransferase [Gaiella occulta]|uniref:Glycosyltransferase n=1 Tax=Gaiella occulta TaxID=1002870 RepID=A0A7M2YXK3_9ACTN|nr:glycosyltransferase family 1 protein [Gaiella occulta]RDI74309.1 Glycosyltransferase [Gaiella occulta]